MDTLQIQISELREKIDRLHQVIEEIGSQVKEIHRAKPQRVEQESYSLPHFASGSAHLIGQNRESEYQLTHKDILVDDNSSNANSSSDNLAPDTQIRRLTAQLTAAYNRIAALEEQLLSYRIHS
jgi:hypothetical protein